TTSMSADGMKILAGVMHGRLYYTADGGVSWQERQPAGDSDQYWRTTAMSADGSRLIAGASPGRLYISTNSGISWVETQPAGDIDKDWSTVSMCDDASRLIAGVDGGRLYINNEPLPLSVSENNNILSGSCLYQNYPNPFNETTKIKYIVGTHNSAVQHIKLIIYNIYGEELIKLVDGMQMPGEYEINYSQVGLPAGIYFYQLLISDPHSGMKYNEIKKMVKIK
ncbi:MAG TPA: T9SS type A sorting domain-containing protein, partial [Candidatus Kapabacteria bacterium]|nr:T9SS type A sorting domain-containing protein [Candidatus Kapabacteria bacterium]